MVTLSGVLVLKKKPSSLAPFTRAPSSTKIIKKNDTHSVYRHDSPARRSTHYFIHCTGILKNIAKFLYLHCKTSVGTIFSCTDMICVSEVITWRGGLVLHRVRTSIFIFWHHRVTHCHQGQKLPYDRGRNL